MRLRLPIVLALVLQACVLAFVLTLVEPGERMSRFAELGFTALGVSEIVVAWWFARREVHRTIIVGHAVVAAGSLVSASSERPGPLSTVYATMGAALLIAGFAMLLRAMRQKLS